MVKSAIQDFESLNSSTYTPVQAYSTSASPQSSVGRASDLKTLGVGFHPRDGQPNNF